MSPSGLSLNFIGKMIAKKYSIKLTLKNEYEIFSNWNGLIDKAENNKNRENIKDYLKDVFSKIRPVSLIKQIASLPISNYIDLTVSRLLYRATIELGKEPILHDFETQRMGSWQHSNPSNPNIFFCFGNCYSNNPWIGVHEQIFLQEQNRIQIENMMEMVDNKDILLLDISSYEAEYMLHLSSLVHSSSKIVNTSDVNNDPVYWSKNGVLIYGQSVSSVIGRLSPHFGTEYTMWDRFGLRKLIDTSRKKDFDCFISYFSGDKDFAKRVENDLSLRGLYIWRDDNEIEIGDSFTDQVEKGLRNSYSFIVVLTHEALKRPWVKEELRAAYNLRLAEEFKILPLLYKECEIPLFLSDYKYADFRDEKRYTEQMGLLEKSIRNAVKKARNKS